MMQALLAVSGMEKPFWIFLIQVFCTVIVVCVALEFMALLIAFGIFLMNWVTDRWGS